MGPIVALALKDLRILFRNKGRIFFTFIWPVVLTVLFGLAFGGSGTAQRKVTIALVDEDDTDGSRAFAKALEGAFDLAPMTRAAAENAVRRGDRTGYVVLTTGFGVASQRLFYGPPRQIELGVDPARRAEAGMIEGLLMKHAADDMQHLLTDPAASTQMVDKALGEMRDAPPEQVAAVQKFLGELKAFVTAPRPPAPPAQQGQWQPLKIVAKDIALEVVRGGRRDRRVLVARGTGLPTQATHIFYTADQSGGVVLRILQNRVPIKMLVLEVPKGLPVGTRVEVVAETGSTNADLATRAQSGENVAGVALLFLVG